MMSYSNTVAGMVRAAQAMIAEDRARGILPPTARSWAALHGHVDANEYLPNSATPAQCAAVAQRLDRWLGGEEA